jgi:uncharacterized protein involved in exopolysaccharide biosynthesis
MMPSLTAPDLAHTDLIGRRLDERGGATGAFSASTLLKSAYYYRRTAYMVFAVVLALGVLAALLTPARYRSEAKLLALTSDSYDVGSNTGDSKSEPFKPEEVVNLEMQLLSSHDLHREAVRRLAGAPSDPVVLERTRESFTKALSVAKAADANVIDLAFTDRDPARANAALARFIEVYQRSRAHLLLSGEAAQLEQQRSTAQRDLSAASDALRRFQAEHGIADIDAQIAGAVTLDTSLRERMADASAGLSGARGSLSRLRATARQVPQTIEMFRDDTEATKGIADMQIQILQLQAKRADLAGRYMAGSPLIVQVDSQLAALRQAVTQQTGQLQAARRTGRNNAYDTAIGQLRETDADAASQAAKRAQLSTDIAASGTRLRSLNGLAATITDLKLRRDVAQERYRLLARQFEDARGRTSDALAGGSNVRVIQAPNLPTARSNPAWLMIAGALFAALLLSGVVLLLRALGRRAVLDDAEAAADARVPVIADAREPFALAGPFAGTLARELAANDRSSGERGRVVAIVASAAQDLDTGCPALIHDLDGGEDNVAIVAVGSTRDGFDPQRFAAGLAKDAVISIGDHAWAIDDASAARIETLRLRYRWVLLVLPPISGDDALSLIARSRAQIAASAGQVLLLVRTEHTPRAAIRTVTALLDRCGKAPSGVILTGNRIAWPPLLTLAA